MTSFSKVYIRASGFKSSCIDAQNIDQDRCTGASSQVRNSVKNRINSVIRKAVKININCRSI